MIQLRVQDRMKTSPEPAAVIFGAIRHRCALLELNVSGTITTNNNDSRPLFSVLEQQSFYCQIEKTVTVKCLFTPQRL